MQTTPCGQITQTQEARAELRNDLLTLCVHASSYDCDSSKMQTTAKKPDFFSFWRTVLGFGHSTFLGKAVFFAPVFTFLMLGTRIFTHLSHLIAHKELSQGIFD